MSAITPAIRPAMGPAIRSAFEGGFAPSLAQQIRNMFVISDGAFYPRTFTTAFQDPDATIPTTSVEQIMGMVLDQSGNGNNAVQATTTARPKLSARVNLFIASQDMTKAAWVSSGDGVTISSPEIITALAVGSAFYQAVTVTPGATYTFSWAAKKGTLARPTYAIYDVTNAVFITLPTRYDNDINSDDYSTLGVEFTVPALCVSARLYLVAGQGTNGGTLYVTNASLTLLKSKTNGVAIGDSFTSSGVYPPHVAIRTACSVVNKGVSGNKLAQLQARFAADVVALSPIFCIIQGGINDIANAAVDPVSGMQAALMSLVDQARISGIRPVLVNTSPWGGYATWTAQRQTWQDSYNSWLTGYASAGGLLLLDIYTLLADPLAPRLLRSVYNSGDHLHPNTAGYLVIGAAVAKALGGLRVHYQRVTDANNYDWQGFPLKVAYDRVDDNLITNFGAALGSNCTVVRSVPGFGAEILTGQTVGTSYTDNVDNCGLLIINRPLTASETATVTRWANQAAQV